MAVDDFYENKKEAFFDYLKTGDEQFQFDLYSVALETFSWAKNLIPGIIVVSAGGLFPFQAEGFIQGYPFYYRSEFGTCSVKVGNPEEGTPYLPEEALWSASLNQEGTTPETFIDCMVILLTILQKQPFRWEFEGHKVRFLNNPDKKWEWEIVEGKETVSGWGETPEAGYLYTQEPSPYLEQHGFDANMQARLWEARMLNSAPVNEDNRVYPALTPTFFTVND